MGPVGPHEWAQNPLCAWRRGNAMHTAVGVGKAIQSTCIYEVAGKGGGRNKIKAGKYILEESEKSKFQEPAVQPSEGYEHDRYLWETHKGQTKQSLGNNQKVYLDSEGNGGPSKVFNKQ